ncbi:MAG: biotin/lipoyl-binding protein, partial [Ignavibacteriae bacterium]|nr:biotin/lipoyl-binding protein [Ignavibacteriota bacterium]
MAFEFKLPELGENIEQADIVKVLVSVGDKVEVDQILLEIETDKATVEVPSEQAGVVKSVNVKDGDTVKVGDVLFTFEESGKVEKKEETVEPKHEDKISEKVPAKEVATEVKQEPSEVESKIIEFKLPELGENIEAAEITKILVSVGDKVNTDDILIEIETDKATVEVPAEFSGVVKEVKVKSGDKVKVGEVVLIVQSGSSAKEERKSEPVKTETSKIETKKEEVKIQSTEPKAAETQIKKESSSSELPRKVDFPKKIAPAAPSVRRFSREIGIDINEVNGSGPGGRISVEDIKKFAKSFNEKIRSGGAGMPIGIKRE